MQGQDSLKAYNNDDLKQEMNKKDTIIVDVRPKASSDKGFIEGTLLLPQGTVFYEKFGAAVLKPYDNVILITEADKEKEALVAISAGNLGAEKVKGYLQGGVDSWKKANLPLKELNTLPAENLANTLKNDQNVVVLDVRTQGEVESTGVIENSINIPLVELANRVSEVPNNKKVYIHCASGGRAAFAYSLLAKEKYNDMISIAGPIDKIVEGGCTFVKKNK